MRKRHVKENLSDPCRTRSNLAPKYDIPLDEKTDFSVRLIPVLSRRRSLSSWKHSVAPVHEISASGIREKTGMNCILYISRSKGESAGISMRSALKSRFPCGSRKDSDPGTLFSVLCLRYLPVSPSPPCGFCSADQRSSAVCFCPDGFTLTANPVPFSTMIPRYSRTPGTFTR